MSAQNATPRTVVLDFGTHSTRAGFAGQRVPDLVFESTVGKAKYRRVVGPPAPEEVVGPPPNARALYAITRPIVRGEILPSFHDKLLQRVWAGLSLQTPPAHVFIAEPPFAGLAGKRATAEALLEKGRARGLFFGTQAVLSLFGYGKTDGLVLEVGEGVTQLAPVFNGYTLTHAMERARFGGEDLTRYFAALLQRAGTLPEGDSFLFNEMKKGLVEALPTAAALERLAGAKDMRRKGQYELPDGEIVNVTREGCEAGELLFKPELDGLCLPSLQELLVGAVKKLDVDLRSYMYRNTYLAGGTAMTAGFPERLGAEIAALVHEKTSVSLFAPAVDKTLLAWQGASALCQLSSFAPQWITRTELEEVGERIFLQKFL